MDGTMSEKQKGKAVARLQPTHSIYEKDDGQYVTLADYQALLDQIECLSIALAAARISSTSDPETPTPVVRETE